MPWFFSMACLPRRASPSRQTRTSRSLREPSAHPAPVLLYTRHGRDRGAQPVTDPVGLMDIASAGDTGWGITSDEPRMLLRADETGAIEPVLNITEYQAAHPDPNDTDGDAEGSNPYGLAALPNGDALIADAQHNDLLRVTAAGDVTVVARFLPEMIGGIPAEAVPTTVDHRSGRLGVRRGAQGVPLRAGHLTHLAHQSHRRRRHVLLSWVQRRLLALRLRLHRDPGHRLQFPQRCSLRL